jgi:hypothetical protein
MDVRRLERKNAHDPSPPVSFGGRLTSRQGAASSDTQNKARHIGSIDVDLALNHKTLKDPGTRTICRLLFERGYHRDEDQPFIFWRTVTVGDRPIDVEVDLLAGEYEGTGKGRRTQAVQDIRARKARGCAGGVSTGFDQGMMHDWE